jgi:Glyoxalase/Bleomycin resistance protein/Dioxygenase superfamily
LSDLGAPEGNCGLRRWRQNPEQILKDCRRAAGHAIIATEQRMSRSAVNERNPHSGSAFQAIRSIDYTVIFVRDMAAMRRFYEDILGFSLLRELFARLD